MEIVILTLLPIFFSIRNLAFNISMAVQFAPGFNEIAINLVSMLTLMAFCPIVPRFILEVRELYDHDTHGRWQGIDTGFGVSQLAIDLEATVAFAVVASADSSGQGVAMEEEDVATGGEGTIPLEVVGMRVHPV